MEKELCLVAFTIVTKKFNQNKEMYTKNQLNICEFMTKINLFEYDL